jgi:Type II site-specific deoxyribonuclease
MSSAREERIRSLAAALNEISDSQLEWTEAVIAQFHIKPGVKRNPESNLVTACVAEEFADALQIHHCLSTEALSKDKFEYALERIMNRCGIPAKLANKGNPGHDITLQGVPYSLKTQANKGIKAGFLHISKFMELGKGAWLVEEDLKGLRDRFFVHMKSYDRILQLRRLIDTVEVQRYELVEVPKALLSKAQDAECKLITASNQNPKPGRCSVIENGVLLFELYFDGGTERKLQIRSLDKRNCIVHAEWDIHRKPLS